MAVHTVSVNCENVLIGADLFTGTVCAGKSGGSQNELLSLNFTQPVDLTQALFDFFRSETQPLVIKIRMGKNIKI